MRCRVSALLLTPVALSLAVPADVKALPSAAAQDPATDPANPASMTAFVLPSGDGAVNAMIYQPSGPGPHPTLLLLHGFPGNEQNLDLAQAARRAGWNVLTLHYRGSWGSPGVFSLLHSSQDAHRALAFLRDAGTIKRFAIDPARIVVAGHSMGGFMAADAAADDPRVAGVFLIDPWDISATIEQIKTPAGLAAWQAEVAGDLPPLAGTSYDALTAEITGNVARFHLIERVEAGGPRRLIMLVGAERGLGASMRKLASDARATTPQLQAVVLPTDHSFSDKRLALTALLLAFLDKIAPTSPTGPVA